MARGRNRRERGAAAAIAALLLCFALASCSGERDTGEGRKIESLVKRFALSNGADACDMLSRHAVARVYGGTSDDPRVGQAACLTASKKFTGERVDVLFVRFNGPRAAHATARTPDGHRYFIVALIKPRGEWKIESVSPSPRPS